jgi:hypothetical protein
MTSTFLHEDKVIPPDEMVDINAPVCECGQRMWLTRIETRVSGLGADSQKLYECKACGASRSTNTTRDTSGL